MFTYRLVIIQVILPYPIEGMLLALIDLIDIINSYAELVGRHKSLVERSVAIKTILRSEIEIARKIELSVETTHDTVVHVNHHHFQMATGL